MTATQFQTLVEMNTQLTALVTQLVGMVSQTNKRMDEGFTRLEKKMDDGFARVDKEMNDGFARVDKEMADGFARVDKEMSEGFARVDQEMTKGFARVDKEMNERFTQAHSNLVEGLAHQEAISYEILNAVAGPFEDLEKDLSNTKKNHGKRLTRLEKRPA